ncbi:MAG: hypothetical protein ACREPD_21790 [Stenotrophomonas sp.]|uniref:hypothetical protein n=1 Tax=Gammaproteobacteria TaxID=1236 RepID=UPI003D6C7581
MPTFLHTALRYLGCVPAVLLVACSGPAGAPAAVTIHNVRSVEIQYQHSGWERADEVHRLQRGAGQRAFTRTSMVEAADGITTTRANVPAQRVGELLWALSAPPWPRERAVQVVARHVSPVWMMENALVTARADVPGCTAKEIRDRMYAHLKGAELRSQVDAYYQGMPWTDDEPAMRVVITFSNGPDRVISSREQTLHMLPWTLGEQSSTDSAAAPQSWSVPVSDALRRPLPSDSQAAQRLANNGDVHLAAHIGRVAEQECVAALGAPRAAR